MSQIRAPRAWGQVWGAPMEYMELFESTNGYLKRNHNHILVIKTDYRMVNQSVFDIRLLYFNWFYTACTNEYCALFFQIVITPDLWAFLGSPPPLWQWASERMVPVKCRWIRISLKTLLWTETGETSPWCCLESLAPPGTRNNEKSLIVTRVLAQFIFFFSCCSWLQDSFLTA